VTKFGDLVFAGLTSGGIYAVFALCFTVLFRTSGILNLAIGDFAMLGALGTDLLVRVEGWNVAGAIAFDLLLVGLFAYLYDFIVLRTALEGRRAQEAAIVIFFFTLALSFFIEGVAQHLFGTDVHSAPTLWAGNALSVGGVHIQRAGVLVIAVALFTGVGFAAYFKFSLSGKAMAACGENALGARIVGIRQRSFRRGMFVAMGVLAAVFGIIGSPITGYVYTSGASLSLLGLIAAAFASFNRPGRAVFAGVVIGLAEAFLGGYVSSQYQDTLLFALMVVVVLAQPNLIGNPLGT
jgi:branched-subunit amino acid ABC-type transport system permease component